MSTDPTPSLISETARAQQTLNSLHARKRAELGLPDTRTGRRRAERAVLKDIARWKKTDAAEQAAAEAPAPENGWVDEIHDFPRPERA